jgi:hypothetical protein
VDAARGLGGSGGSGGPEVEGIDEAAGSKTKLKRNETLQRTIGRIVTLNRNGTTRRRSAVSHNCTNYHEIMVVGAACGDRRPWSVERRELPNFYKRV